MRLSKIRKLITEGTWFRLYSGHLMPRPHTVLLLIIKVFSRLFTHLTERRSKHKPQPNNTHIWVQTQFNYKRLHWNITFFKPIKSFSSIMNIKHLNRHQPLYRATVDTGQSSVMKQKVMLYWAVMRQTERNSLSQSFITATHHWFKSNKKSLVKQIRWVQLR